MPVDIQVEHGYTRVAHRLLTAVALAPWDSAAQLKVVCALLRASYGMQRRDAAIGLAQWRETTGQSEAAVKRALEALRSNGVLMVVREEDSKRCIPKTWRLQKDFTLWKRFRVSAEAVDQVESIVTQGLRTPQGSHVNPGSPTTPGTEVNPGSSTNPAPGSSTTPGPGSPTTPGRGSEPLSHNASQAPKDRKDRKDIRTTALPDIQPHASPPVAGGRDVESTAGDEPDDLRAKDHETILHVWHLGRDVVSINGKPVSMKLEMRIHAALVKQSDADTVHMALPHVRAVESFPPDQPISLRLLEQRPEVMERMIGRALKLLDGGGTTTRGGDPTPLGALLTESVPIPAKPPPRAAEDQRSRNRRSIEALRAAGGT